MRELPRIYIRVSQFLEITLKIYFENVAKVQKSKKRQDNVARRNSKGDMMIIQELRN